MGLQGICNIKPIQWLPEYETGRPEIDIQHRYLVELINRVSDYINRGDLDNEAFGRLLEEFWTFAEYHFSAEEALMAHYQIDARHQTGHIQDHDAFFTELRTRYDALDTSNLKSAKALHQFLSQWIEHHTLGEDMALMKQIAAIEAGKTPAQAYLAPEGNKDFDALTSLSPQTVTAG